MKIAALILAHHRPDLLGRLTNRLRGDLWNTYIHLDKKSNPAEFSDIHATGFLHQYRVNWGGYSTVAAILSLIERALSDQENTHFLFDERAMFPDQARFPNRGNRQRQLHGNPQDASSA